MKGLEKFLAENTKDGGFLQSPIWKSIQEKSGKETFLLRESGFSALLSKQPLPIAGSYLYCPRGPAVEENNSRAWKELAKRMAALALEARTAWIRVEPQNFQDIEEIKKNINYRVFEAPKNYEPEETVMIDLKPSRKELLAQMKSKTRYNIKLSQRKKVAVKESGDFESFWKILQETAERDKIKLHPKSHYKNLLNSEFRDFIHLYMAYQGETPLGGIIVSIYGGVATYLHGASTYAQRNLMGNYALQWHAIKKAKQEGAEKYDLRGTAIEVKKKGWEGITYFKKGFCPSCPLVKFPGCFDIIIDRKRYFLYRFLRKIKSFAK